MKKVLPFCLLLTILLLGSISINAKDFLILNITKYHKLSKKGDKSVLKRCIVFNRIEKQGENAHLIENNIDKTAHLLYLLSKNRLNESKKFIAQHDSSLIIHQFYLGLQKFIEGSYEEATFYLKAYKESDFRYHKNLLIADCFLELNGGSESEKILAYYQTALDSANTISEAEIVKDRIKFIIYKK